MIGFYPYFLSSLPFLEFNAELPFSPEEFVNKAAEFLSSLDLTMLKNALSPVASIGPVHPVTKNWLEFNIVFKNELARLRATKKKIPVEKYIRPQKEQNLNLIPLIQHAIRQPSPIDAEKELDGIKWRYLEELSLGHYFDLQAVIIYLYKLKIIERWSKIQKADKEKILLSL